MREILFRGKRISDGDWVLGGIMKVFHPNFDHESPEAFNLRKENCYCICSDGKDYFVEQDSIGQYTGLCDKNGDKIFEGDIVKFKRDNALGYTTVRTGEVRYYDKLPIFYVMATTGDAWDWVECEDFEVIGNSQDNPELLKGGAE